MDISLIPEILASSIRMAVPLILACLAGLWSERSGIVDIGLEGKMLAGAFAAASASFYFQSVWMGLLIAILVSVDTAGISVARLRYKAVIIAGVLCGIAGAYLSTSLSASFVRDMSAGRGFMALAALIFANWRAWPALYTCLLFGFLQAIGNFMQGARIGSFEIPVQFFNALPYVMTVVLLAGFIGKSIPPRASG